MKPNTGSTWPEKLSIQVRDWVRSGIRRLKNGWWQIVQTGVAAGVAWLLAYVILGSERPEFAPIAAVIALGLAVSERGRRAIELVLGVAFGAITANLFVLAVGVGPVQIGLLVALAMAVAVFFGRGDLGVNEAAISGMILVAAFWPSSTGYAPDRFLEALIGSGTALLINALIPINPKRIVQRAAHPVFGDSVAVLEEVAAALEDGDFEKAQGAVIKSRELDARVSGFKEALAAGHETARIAPPRRKALGHLKLYVAVADQIDLTVRDVRALARAALSVVEPGSPAPEHLSTALRSLGQATESLASYLDAPEDPEETRNIALSAARCASSLLQERQELATDLAINALIDQIYSAVVDILGGTGMDREPALQALRNALNGYPEAD